MSTPEKQPFNPADHFRNLKGQQYLECKWRIVWFREQHPDGYIRTEMVEHDPIGGLAVFRAQVGFWTAEEREVYATGYGSETRKDFGDYLEKAETKGVARALALLGYGTAHALEFDEGERIVDSPATRSQGTQQPTRQGSNGRTTTVHEPPPGALRESTDTAERRKLYKLLAADPEAAKLMDAALAAKNTTLDAQDMDYVRKAIVALEARIVDSPLGDEAEEPDPTQRQEPPLPYRPERRIELNQYIDRACSQREALQASGKTKPAAEDMNAWRSLYGQGQELTQLNSPVVAGLPAADVVAWVERFKSAAQDELKETSAI